MKLTVAQARMLRSRYVSESRCWEKIKEFIG